MSHQALLWALKQPVAKRGAITDALASGEEPPGLSTNESLILIRLADHSNGQTGMCFPKMDLLAEETGLARSTVQNVIAALCDFGLISIDPSCAPPKRTRGAEKPVNGYRLHTDRRYGSIPVSGMARDRPAVSNQEPNLEVPAAPPLDTQPGIQECESDTIEGLTWEQVDRLPPVAESSPEDIPVWAGPEATQLAQRSVQDSTPVTSRPSPVREATDEASRQWTMWACGSPEGCPCNGDPAKLGYCLHPAEVPAELDHNGHLKPIGQVPDNVRPFRRKPA